MRTSGSFYEFRRARGRRGVVLSLLGVLWVIQGLAVLQNPYANGASHRLLHEYLPIWLRVALWAGLGVSALYCAARFSPTRDRFGYTALVVMPLERSLSYGLAWLQYILPSDGGLSRGLAGAAAWGTIAALIMIIAGWPEAEQRRSC